MRRRGFTLVELLVVVSVIAILIGILVPSMRSARQSAKRTACAAHLKQVGIGFLSYLQSNNDRLPYASYLPSITSEPCDKTIYIADVIGPQMGKQVKVLQCPEDKAGRYDRGAPNDNKSYYESERSSYEYRIDFRGGGLVMGKTITEVSRRFEEWLNRPIPTNSIYIMRDYNNFHSRKAKPAGAGGPPSSESGARRYLYIDGHVADYEQM